MAKAETKDRELSPGRYWLTFPWGGDRHRRRVLLQHDEAGVLRSVWADEHWRAFPPIGPGDIGLRVDEMDPETQLEPVDATPVLETDELVDRCRRASGTRCGILRACCRRRSATTVDGRDVRQRVDELADDVVFTRIGD